MDDPIANVLERLLEKAESHPELLLLLLGSFLIPIVAALAYALLARRRHPFLFSRLLAIIAVIPLNVAVVAFWAMVFLVAEKVFDVFQLGAPNDIGAGIISVSGGYIIAMIGSLAYHGYALVFRYWPMAANSIAVATAGVLGILSCITVLRPPHDGWPLWWLAVFLTGFMVMLAADRIARKYIVSARIPFNASTTTPRAWP